MTVAIELIDRVKSLGARLWVAGGRLQLDAPADFPDDVIDQLRANRIAVLHALGQEVSTDAELLAWASGLAEQGTVLSEMVRYVETPLRTVTTNRVSWYAGLYLRIISYARMSQSTDGGGRWTPEWWREQADEALGALRALRDALEEQKT